MEAKQFSIAVAARDIVLIALIVLAEGSLYVLVSGTTRHPGLPPFDVHREDELPDGVSIASVASS
jgi:hypothetical protein